MSIFGKIRSLIPASSRSFHELFGYAVRTSNELSAQIEALRNDIREVEDAVQAHDAHMKLYAQQLYRADGETTEEAQARFFRNLPKATGTLRLQQLVGLKLLRDFDELCSEHGLDYWIAYGTLLGAYRHGGFIPWDDDIDIGMTRADIGKLMEVVESDGRFAITEKFDWYARCRQVRFWYRDELIPCFLDVFLFDYATVPCSEAHARIQADRARMIKSLERDQAADSTWQGKVYVTSDTVIGANVADTFDDAVSQEYGEGGFLTDDPEKAVSIVYGVDNDSSPAGWDYTIPTEALFPLGNLEFEGLTLPAPNDPETVIARSYGDFMSLPNDINTHFTHIDDAVLKDDRVVKAMEGLAGEALK